MTDHDQRELEKKWTAELEKILIHKGEELGNRLSWLAAIVTRGLWENLA